MYPRPRSRKTPLEVIDAEDLAEDCAQARRENQMPAVAVLTGQRDWIALKRQLAFAKYGRHWPGGEETFCGVPVIISRWATSPTVIPTMSELEDALLGRE